MLVANGEDLIKADMAHALNLALILQLLNERENHQYYDENKHET